MKFLTKEWSQQMSKKGFLLSSPQVTPQAAAFSEPFYQALYQEAQKKHLNLMGKVAALSRKPFQAEREAEQFRQTHQRRVEELRRFLPQEILDECGSIVQVPGENSLNVAIAGSTVLYDKLSKQHHNKAI